MRWPRHSLYLWLLAAMAVFGQIMGAAAMPERAEAAPLGVICSWDTPKPGQPAGHHHHHDCAVCPGCAAIALHAAVVSPGPSLPPPGTMALASAAPPPPARAPPSWRCASRFPRGPPALA